MSTLSLIYAFINLISLSHSLQAHLTLLGSKGPVATTTNMI